MPDVLSALVSMLVPGSGGGRLLARLVEAGGDELSLAEVARSAGVSAATATREADRLLAAGLLTEQRAGRERLVAIDTASPYYGPLLDLVFLAHGLQPRPRPRPYEPSTTHDLYAVNDLAVLDRMPAALRSDRWGTTSLPGEVYDGPPLLQVRAWVLRLRPLAQRARSMEARLQETYRRWHEERDRDLIHATLHAGAGTWQALNVLTAAAKHRRVDDDASGADTPVGRLAWAHAVHAVAAEASVCRAIAARLEQAVELGAKHQHAQLHVRQLEEQLTRVRSADRDDPYVRQAEPRLADQRAELAAAEAALDGHYHYGGLSSSASVGAAGERLLVVEADRVATQAAQLAGEMAAHACFTAWQRDNPGAASLDLEPRAAGSPT